MENHMIDPPEGWLDSEPDEPPCPCCGQYPCIFFVTKADVIEKEDSDDIAF